MFLGIIMFRVVKLSVLILLILSLGCSSKITRKTAYPDNQPKERWEETRYRADGSVKDGLYQAWYPNDLHGPLR